MTSMGVGVLVKLFKFDKWEMFLGHFLMAIKCCRGVVFRLKLQNDLLKGKVMGNGVTKECKSLLFFRKIMNIIIKLHNL